MPLLQELGQAFHAAPDPDALLVSILGQVRSAADGEGVSIWLLDQAHATLSCTHAVGPQAEGLVGRNLSAADLLATEIFARAVALPIDELGLPPEARAHLADQVGRGAQSLILAALVVHGERLGALAVANPGKATFSDGDRALVAALGGTAALAIRNARLGEQQRRHNERQDLSEQISRHLQQALEIDVLIPLILHEVNKAIEAEAQSLWLLDRETGLMVCHYATGPNADAIKKVTVPMGLGILGSSVERLLPIMVSDAQADDLVFRGADQQTGFVTRSLLCVPLVRQGRAIGAVEAVNKRGGGRFTQRDLDLLRNIADSAALSLENARLYIDLAASYDSTLEALMGALDSRDRETEGHSRRVSDYTVRLAQEVGLEGAEIATIRRGALIHDIGKMSIPDAILNKPGPLDAEERRIIQMHPVSGYEMLFGIPQLKDELSIVLAHHERWDGAGYPFGLAAEAIPLAARLFSVSDTFDAVTSERPYRPARSCEEAFRVIASEKGRQFDPAAVDAFQAIPPGEWAAIRDGVLAGLTRRRASRDEQLRRRHSEMRASRPNGAPPRQR